MFSSRSERSTCFPLTFGYPRFLIHLISTSPLAWLHRGSAVKIQENMVQCSGLRDDCDDCDDCDDDCDDDDDDDGDDDDDDDKDKYYIMTHES